MKSASKFVPINHEMAASYNPATVESPIYEWWEKNNFFSPSNPENEPFTIIMPPPNLTGALHLGHALTVAIEDALTRWHRMLGHDTLWLPGVDHAAIAVNALIEKQLREEDKSRHDVGRDAFLDRTWAFVENNRSRISTQHKRLGASADWEREAFTADAERELSVRTTFKNLYDDGLIFRAERLINWCIGCRSAISDIEVEYDDEDGSFWYIKYMLDDESGKSVIVATTRPETIPADVAVAVNPNDERNAHLIGKKCFVPTTNRTIPIIGDDGIDIELGSGALKVTPAHDQIDFDIGEKHNLEIINILNPDGTLNELAGKYGGLSLDATRQLIVKDMKKLGLIERTEPYTHAVGHCQRCSTIVEPLISEQWWINAKQLAKPAIQAVTSKQIAFVPSRFQKTYLGWMENIRDWCISRQIWWGHRIPVWYCTDCGHLTVSVVDRDSCESCDSVNVSQDEDTLDTWFSSGLWPHSTLGWPENLDADLKRFYPTQVLETGYDIIFFWVARMIMLSIYNMNGVPPFKTVYLHGLVRGADGKKMSKSTGNIVDPLEAIETYGCDGLRYALISGTSPGNDQKLTDDRLESGRNFANKLWNAGRFVISLREQHKDKVTAVPSQPALEDKWISSRLAALTEEVDRLLTNYELSEALRQIRDFFWDDFADWYLEIAKIRIRNEDYTPLTVLTETYETTLRLVHPFMPFISEEIWQRLQNSIVSSDEEQALIVATYPNSEEIKSKKDSDAITRFSAVQEFIRSVRNIRSENKVDAARKIECFLVTSEYTDDLTNLSAAIKSLGRIEPLHIVSEINQAPTDQVVSQVTDGGTVVVPLGGLFDLETERNRLREDLQTVQQEIERQNQKLENQEFRQKAPEPVVQKELDKLEAARAKAVRISDRLQEIVTD